MDFFSLVRQNGILESILDCIFDDLLIIDKKGFIVYISRNTSENLGANRDELIGKMLSLTPIKITRSIVPCDSFEHGCITGPSLKQNTAAFVGRNGCQTSRNYCFRYSERRPS